MDILRKELNSIYAAQQLDSERLDARVLASCRERAAAMVSVNRACAVVTDAAADRCYVYAGVLGALLGLTDDESLCREMASSDEDIIYERLHPEDLVEKRMLEYEFFRFIDSLSPGEKLDWKATCRIRIKARDGRYIYIDNSTQIFNLSPGGKMWLILCCYDLSPSQQGAEGIRPHIVNSRTGEVVTLSLSEHRAQVLTDREKEILTLVRDGYASKQIAGILGISIHTVNRHRQNILEKLSVGNSVEAVMAAGAMKLL